MGPLTEPPRPGDLAFTCVVPVWAGDHPDHFRAALKSLAASTLRPTAVLIAADGELPTSLGEIVEEARRSGARVDANAGPRGLHHNLNRALAAVSTPWVARFDADDVNLPARFELQTRFLSENPDISVVGGTIVEFSEDGRERAKSMPLLHDAIVRQARWRNPINHMTAFFRRDHVLEAGGYPELPRKEDYGLWLALIGRGRRLANLEAPLVRARLGADFHARRAGLHNLRSEYELFRLKRRTGRIGTAPALAAMVLRAGVLALEGPAAFAYRRVLRR